MARRNIADLADKTSTDSSVRKEGVVKFVSMYKEFHFLMKCVGEDGKQTYHTDANGNGKMADTKMYDFTTVYPKDPKTGRPDVGAAYCIFLADPAILGDQYEAVVKRLDELKKNPKNRLYDDEGYFKARNPEAFRLAKDKSELEDKLSEKDKKIAELEQRLGVKRQG